ncbi:MAG: carbohydrate porin [Candidatus Obscuribacterales bacterium]|nr:carbohydrate porin [Candidatus Obscuribacterales bacterium]
MATKHPYLILPILVSILNWSAPLQAQEPDSTKKPTAIETLSASPKELGGPITLRPVDDLRRDLENLAKKANVELPPSATPTEPLTHSALGRYFLVLLPKLSQLPPGQLSSRDIQDIGILSEEFENSMQEVRGTMILHAFKNSTADFKQIDAKVEEAKARLSVIEKLKINGDFTFAPQSDMGRSDRDSMAANLRARINFLARVKEAKPEDKLGEGYVFARLTAAAGRFFPRNKFLMSPLNDIVDANASPYNSGPNEVQVPNLVINNNNSNSLRPTVSLEQAYYSQDFRPGGQVKGNFKTGLVYLGAMFDNNNFANNEALQFMNTQFVNSTSWRPNLNGPAMVASLEQPLFRGKAFIRGTSAIATISNRDFFGCYGFNHEAQFGHTFLNKEGNLRAGFWNWNFRRGSNTPFTTPSDLFGTGLLSVIPGGSGANGPKPVGFYLNADQRIWKDIGIWGRYALNDKNIGEVFLGGLLTSRQSWSIGSEIPLKIIFPKKRPDDVIGIAYGQISGLYRDGITSPSTPAFLSLNGVPANNIQQVNQNLVTMTGGTRRSDEKALEVYYRYQINKNISVSPDVQYVFSPGGSAPVPGIFAVGTRLNIVF